MPSSGRRHLGDPTRWAQIQALARDEVRSLLLAASGRFYVYVLCESDGTPSYVGKGAGDRAFQHEADPAALGAGGRGVVIENGCGGDMIHASLVEPVGLIEHLPSRERAFSVLIAAASLWLIV